MTDQPISHARVLAILEAYGANPARWPVAERNPAATLIAGSPDLLAAQAAARALDGLLDDSAAAHVVPDAHAALTRTILAARPGRAPPPPRQNLLRMVGTMAASAVFGAGLGVGAVGLAPVRPAPEPVVAAAPLDSVTVEALWLAALSGDAAPFLDEAMQ